MMDGNIEEHIRNPAVPDGHITGVFVKIGRVQVMPVPLSRAQQIPEASRNLLQICMTT